jgi:hypothetical protein
MHLSRRGMLRWSVQQWRRGVAELKGRAVHDRRLAHLKAWALLTWRIALARSRAVSVMIASHSLLRLRDALGRWRDEAGGERARLWRRGWARRVAVRRWRDWAVLKGRRREAAQRRAMRSWALGVWRRYARRRRMVDMLAARAEAAGKEAHRRAAMRAVLLRLRARCRAARAVRQRVQAARRRVSCSSKTEYSVNLRQMVVGSWQALLRCVRRWRAMARAVAYRRGRREAAQAFYGRRLCQRVLLEWWSLACPHHADVGHG